MSTRHHAQPHRLRDVVRQAVAQAHPENYLAQRFVQLAVARALVELHSADATRRVKPDLRDHLVILALQALGTSQLILELARDHVRIPAAAFVAGTASADADPAAGSEIGGH